MWRLARTRFALTSLATVLLAAAAAAFPASGPEPGQSLVPFEPHHVAGPFADTKTCPVCEFPLNPGVMVWVFGESQENIVAIASALERRVRMANAARSGSEKLVAFVVFLDDSTTAEPRLQAIADRAGLTSTALAVLPPDSRAVADNRIRLSPFVRSTTLVYRAGEVRANLRNLRPGDLGTLDAAIDAVLAK